MESFNKSKLTNLRKALVKKYDANDVVLLELLEVIDRNHSRFTIIADEEAKQRRLEITAEFNKEYGFCECGEELTHTYFYQHRQECCPYKHRKIPPTWVANDRMDKRNRKRLGELVREMREYIDYNKDPALYRCFNSKSCPTTKDEYNLMYEEILELGKPFGFTYEWAKM
jgi:hypothetical protein